MKVRMLSALVGPETNLMPGDIIDTAEGARWIEAGIAEAVREERKVETASKPLAPETAELKRKTVARKAATKIMDKGAE